MSDTRNEAGQRLTPAQAVQQVIEAGRLAAERGWVPATSGNFSVRVGGQMAITRSGRDKGSLTVDDVALVSLAEPLPPGLSAEAPLHQARYRADPTIGAILHVHAPGSAVISRAYASRGKLLLHGWELQKAFAGITTHETTLLVPVFNNQQDTVTLADEVESALRDVLPIRVAPGYLLAGHGLYVWGRDTDEARRHLEAFDVLLQQQWQFDRLTADLSHG
ncbi:methylthioribulose 1-phosphate dehydratase [Neisseriaceae bacterium JH1-16]|nr:methylthioribulose 1-phosphate dehydratase [Neisseriaceae bacterium JH1-16]